MLNVLTNSLYRELMEQNRFPFNTCRFEDSEITNSAFDVFICLKRDLINRNLIVPNEFGPVFYRAHARTSVVDAEDDY